MEKQKKEKPGLLQAIQNKAIRKHVASILKTDTSALKEFEDAYKKTSLEFQTDNLFQINAKQAAEVHEGALICDNELLDTVINKIVNSLIMQTSYWKCENGKVISVEGQDAPEQYKVTREELSSLPENIRPDLTGELTRVDFKIPSSEILITQWDAWKKTGNIMYYHMFRQGLDLLDIDPVTYQMIDMNPNSCGYWLPKIVQPVYKQSFFKIPDTTIIKVPLTLLQLTKIEYSTFSKTTMEILNAYCRKIFQLNEQNDYFIRTGVCSSKYDFRNAHVHGAKEVRELGEYLMFIHFQANMRAGYNIDMKTGNTISNYGSGTTTEWVVREFIPDGEDNLKIYHGLPLRTEYRVFVDFDTDQVIGIHPYWDGELMKSHFDMYDDPDSTHDYITFTANEVRMISRYNKHRNMIVNKIEQIAGAIDLPGQWSVDIMQNGDDFYIIDLARAQESVYYDCIPEEKRKTLVQNWMPEIELQKK